jgi:hypothetical protein
VWVLYADVLVTDVRFFGNEARNGTGLSQGGAVGSQDSRVTICRSSFESNACKEGAGEHLGGAIYINGRTDLNITGSQFLGNEVLDPSGLGKRSFGGAIRVVGSKSTLSPSLNTIVQ